MHTLTLGEVSISRIVEIGRSAFPTAQMLPESDAGRIGEHHRWMKPHFWDDVTGDLGSRIQTWIVRTPQHTVLVDTGVGNDKESSVFVPVAVRAVIKLRASHASVRLKPRLLADALKPYVQHDGVRP